MVLTLMMSDLKTIVKNYARKDKVVLLQALFRLKNLSSSKHARSARIIKILKDDVNLAVKGSVEIHVTGPTCQPDSEHNA